MRGFLRVKAACCHGNAVHSTDTRRLFQRAFLHARPRRENNSQGVWHDSSLTVTFKSTLDVWFSRSSSLYFSLHLSLWEQTVKTHLRVILIVCGVIAQITVYQSCCCQSAGCIESFPTLSSHSQRVFCCRRVSMPHFPDCYQIQWNHQNHDPTHLLLFLSAIVLKKRQLNTWNVIVKLIALVAAIESLRFENNNIEYIECGLSNLHLIHSFRNYTWTFFSSGRAGQYNTKSSVPTGHSISRWWYVF